MTAKEKQCVGNEQIHLVFLFYDGGERVDTVSHVGVTADDIDASK